MGEVILRDVFPAEVSLSDGRLFTGVRIFLTDKRLLVYKADKERKIGKELELNLTYTSADKSRNTLMAGERLEFFSPEVTGVVNKGRGCGCSSPLKGMMLPTSLEGEQLSWSGKKR